MILCRHHPPTHRHIALPSYLLLLLTSFSWLAGCSESESKATSTRIPSIVLIVVDTLRPDYLSPYGSRFATPHIESLAQRGALFESAYTHIPATGPSHASLFTGLLPLDHGVTANTSVLQPENETLAEVLAAHGYTTAAFVSLGVLGRKYGFAQGFQTYVDEFPRQWFRNAAEVNHDVLPWLDQGAKDPFFLWVHYSDPHEPYTSPDLSFPMIEVLRNGEPFAIAESNGYRHVFDLKLAPGSTVLEFRSPSAGSDVVFVFRHLKSPDKSIEMELESGWRVPEMEPNAAYIHTRLPATVRLSNPMQHTIRTDIRFSAELQLNHETRHEAYGAEVEFVDGQIGRLLSALDKRGVLDDSIIVFTSDHGEALGEHENHIGHVHQLYDPSVKVPLIVVAPGRIAPSVSASSPVRLIDVFPTILDLLGIQPPLDSKLRGGSLLPLLANQQTTESAVPLMTFRPFARSDRQGIRYGKYKYIRTLAPEPTEELFDLDADPLEHSNLASQEAEVLEHMRDILERQLAAAQGANSAPSELSEEELDLLRALGYVLN